MRTIARLFLSLAPLAAGCGTATTPEYAGGEDCAQTVSIAYLKSLCRTGSVPIARELRIEGQLVANDFFGEFPRRLIIEDATGGIEILIDRNALYKEFETGYYLKIYCNGLALGDYGGKIQLGAPPTDRYAVDRIAASELHRFVRHSDTHAAQAPRPDTLTFDTRRDPRRIATYVLFERVGFAREEIGEPFCPVDPETGRREAIDRHLVDLRGDTLHVRFEPTTLYAAEPIPEGRGTVCGILDYFNGDYLLRITNRELLFDRDAEER
ncbi:MAG: hypothetical protein K2O63_01700 [Alistipes sp.]|nr:hypothetical protein [Alistipes sp.]